MLCNHSKPSTHLTCDRHISQTIASLWLPIRPFDMLLVPRQNISSNIVFARNIMNFQVQFSKTLQPTGLASVEVGLNEYVYEWLMISIYVTYITM